MIVVFATPYAMRDVGPLTAIIWAGFCVLTIVWVWFCLPEFSGRTLGEIDELFEAKVPAWRSKKYQTRIAAEREAEKSGTLAMQEVGKDKASTNKSEEEGLDSVDRK